MSTFERWYRGEFYEIWLTRQESGCQIIDFEHTLAPAVYKRLRGILERTANEGHYTEEEIHRYIGEGIWEFKAQTARLYHFNDALRIVLTHGGMKPKSVVNERKKALRIQNEYEEWKGKGRT